MTSGVAATHAEHALRERVGNTVCIRVREPARVTPSAGGGVEDKDDIAPPLGAAFPGTFSGEIGASGNDQSAVAYAGEGGREAFRVGKTRQGFPSERNGRF